MDVIFQRFEEIALTENYIKQLHSKLMSILGGSLLVLDKLLVVSSHNLI